MDRLRGLIEALEIFSRYYPDADIVAEHDEFHVCIPWEDVSVPDIAHLMELGWRLDDNGTYVLPT